MVPPSAIAGGIKRWTQCAHLCFASADKSTHGFSRGKTTPGVVILVGGRQPTCLVCLPSRRLSSVKNSEGLAGRSGALSARQRTQACCRMSRTITQRTAVQSGPQARVLLSTDASLVLFKDRMVTNCLRRFPALCNCGCILQKSRPFVNREFSAPRQIWP